MRILDWRPWAERWLARPAVGGAFERGFGLGGRLAGLVADGLAARRARRRRRPPDGILLVSLGNLRLGGTGKTPVVLALARDLQAAGRRGAILLRGYGSRREQPLTVAPGDRRAGDEARLLAAGLAGDGWTVMQARRRDEGLRRLLDLRPRPEIVLLEDGFQTAGIGRHLDVLILDRWTLHDGRLDASAEAVLPCGPYRETARGAGRAQVWLLETGDEAVLGAAPARGRPEILGFTRCHELVAAQGAPIGPAAAGGEVVWGLLSGLARPENFERAAVALLPRPPVLAVRCTDHCRYEDAMLAGIFAAGRKAGIEAWATTGKDWVKLRDRWPSGLPVALVHQAVAWTGARTLPDLVEERLAQLERAPGGRIG